MFPIKVGVGMGTKCLKNQKLCQTGPFVVHENWFMPIQDEQPMNQINCPQFYGSLCFKKGVHFSIIQLLRCDRSELRRHFNVFQDHLSHAVMAGYKSEPRGHLNAFQAQFHCTTAVVWHRSEAVYLHHTFTPLPWLEAVFFHHFHHTTTMAWSRSMLGDHLNASLAHLCCVATSTQNGSGLWRQLS